MQTFAERLISLREDKGWKKKELAEKLHVSDSMISQYESGRCMPSYDVIITIARLFHVSVAIYFAVAQRLFLLPTCSSRKSLRLSFLRSAGAFPPITEE